MVKVNLIKGLVTFGAYTYVYRVHRGTAMRERMGHNLTGAHVE